MHQHLMLENPGSCCPVAHFFLRASLHTAGLEAAATGMTYSFSLPLWLSLHFSAGTVAVAAAKSGVNKI